MPEPRTVHLTVRDGKRVRGTRGELIGETGVRAPFPLPSHWLRRLREGAMESADVQLTPAGGARLLTRTAKKPKE